MRLFNFHYVFLNKSLMNWIEMLLYLLYMSTHSSKFEKLLFYFQYKAVEDMEKKKKKSTHIIFPF